MADRVGTIETGVDDLLRVLKNNPRISIPDVAKELRIDQNVVQTWIDFLIEEGIVGIEYKFITPYIYLIEKNKATKEGMRKDPLDIKKEFYDKAFARNIPVSRIHMLWNQYVSNNLIEIKEQFVSQAKSRGMDESHIEKLWSKYKMYLLRTEVN